MLAAFSTASTIIIAEFSRPHQTSKVFALLEQMGIWGMEKWKEITATLCYCASKYHLNDGRYWQNYGTAGREVLDYNFCCFQGELLRALKHRKQIGRWGKLRFEGKYRRRDSDLWEWNNFCFTTCDWLFYEAKNLHKHCNVSYAGLLWSLFWSLWCNLGTD